MVIAMLIIVVMCCMSWPRSAALSFCCVFSVFAMGRKRTLSTTATAVAGGGLQRGSNIVAAVAANPVAAVAVKRRRINDLDDLADVVVEQTLLLDWMGRHKYLASYSRNQTMFSKLQARLSPDEWLHGQKTGRKVSAESIIPLHEYSAGRPEPQLRIFSQLSIFESFEKAAVAARKKAVAAKSKAMANKRGWRLASPPDSRSCGPQ